MKYYKEIDGKQVFFKGNVLYLNNQTIVNPTHEQMLEAGWLVYNEPGLTAEELLQQAKLEKILQIDNYDASSNVECFFIDNVPMWLGHELRQQIKTSVEAYLAMGQTEVTKIFNGMEFTFGCDTWLQMLAALEIYAAEALNVTERHKIAVERITNVQDVLNYDYTANYPDKLRFTTNNESE